MTAVLFIRAPNGDVVAELDSFSQFDAIDRHLDVGSWTLTAPTSNTAELLATPGYGIIADLDGQEFIAGPTTTIEESWTVEAGFQTVVSGLSDSSRLWEYLCYPSVPPFAADDYDAPATAVAETVMKHYVTYNVLDSSRKPSATPALTVGTNLARGTSVKTQARFETVGDKLVAISSTGGGLGFQVKDLIFDVYQPTDRSAAQVFSLDAGNLLSFKSKRTRPTANRIICGGSGDGTARVFRIGVNSTSADLWGAYVESFRDRRDTGDTTQLDQSIGEELVKGAEKIELTLRTIDVPHRAYRTDWNLGDIVTAQGVQGTVNQVQLTLNDKGQVIMPSVNSAGSLAVSAVLSAYDQLRQLRKRVAYLERTV